MSIKRHSFLCLHNSVRSEFVLLLVAILVMISGVSNARWGGTDTQHMDQLYQMEENHSNFVQNYYQSLNKYNKKLNTEIEALKDLNYLKKNYPDVFKAKIKILKKAGFVKNGELTGDWYKYVDGRILKSN